ncbi:MAG: sigma-70 family RNA polymerase sigma factor [Deltaproteobacteria bacterium]|nr:sigma-70 family RNA polymerase sigma factor [Deltaproteobacteria bacterium]
MSEGDAGSIADYLKSEYTRMVQYVRSRIREAADRDSEDIVNDVMARIFERADISAPIENVAAYVYRSLKNSIIDSLRKRNEASVSLDDEFIFVDRDLPVADRNDPQSLVQKKEIADALYEEVMRLPEELRSAFMLNEVDGLTFREMSEQTGVPAGTLMARKSRAVDLLTKRLSDLRIYLEE